MEAADVSVRIAVIDYRLTTTSKVTTFMVNNARNPDSLRLL